MFILHNCCKVETRRNFPSSTNSDIYEIIELQVTDENEVVKNKILLESVQEFCDLFKFVFDDIENRENTVGTFIMEKHLITYLHIYIYENCIMTDFPIGFKIILK